MKAQIEKQKAQLAILEAFEAKYGEKIPAEIVTAAVQYYQDRPEVQFATGYSREDKGKVLCLVGLVFGTSGWTSKKNVFDRFDWSREIDGVKVVIESAEEAPPMPASAPVPAHKFPLLLNPSPNGKTPFGNDCDEVPIPF